MTRTKIFLLVFLLGWTTGVAPTQVTAQDIEIDPFGWNFGSVELGSSESMFFELLSLGPVPLTVCMLEITESESMSSAESPFFSISLLPPLPDVIPPGDMITFEVTFSPTELGFQDAFLHIWSDATPPDSNLSFLLQGTGVSAGPIPEPSTLLLMVSGVVALLFLRRRRRPGQ